MEFQNTRVTLNKNKAIGKVLFIVEGGWTEPYILRRIFTTIFDYQFETILRDKGYKQYNSKDNPGYDRQGMLLFMLLKNCYTASNRLELVR